MNNTRTPAFLMGNLGVEVERFYTATDATRREESHARIMRIVDSLRNNAELQGRTGEIDIICDILEDTKSASHKYHVTPEDLQAYFMPFALKALS